MYISIAGTIGLFGTIPDHLHNASLTENAAKIIIDSSLLDKKYLSFVGMSESTRLQIATLTHAVGVPKLALERIRLIQIPLPDLETQRAIVAEIEAEQRLVAASRELITRFEAKIKAAIGRVWGESDAQTETQPLPV